jgi:hypothetical protein
VCFLYIVTKPIVYFNCTDAVLSGRQEILAQGSLLAVITITECIFTWYFGKLWLLGKLIGEKDGLKWHVPCGRRAVSEPSR